MSNVATGWALEVRTGSPTDKLVLLCLAERHNKDDGYARPSLKKMCADTELSERTVRYALRRLEQAGFLSIETRRNRPSLYRFPPLWVGAALAPPPRQDMPQVGQQVPRGGAGAAPEPKGTVNEPGIGSSYEPPDGILGPDEVVALLRGVRKRLARKETA